MFVVASIMKIMKNSGDVATRDAIQMSLEKIDWECEDFDEEERFIW